MSRISGIKGFIVLSKKPKEPMWTQNFGDENLSTITLRDAVAKVTKDPAVLGEKWRRHRFNIVMNQGGPLLDEKLASITTGDVNKLFKKENFTPDGRDKFANALGPIMRYVKNGFVFNEPKRGRPTFSPATNETNHSTIVIKQRQIITEEEALKLIAGAKGRYAEFREQLSEELEKLEPGQCYAFVPENLSKDPTTREKEIAGLKTAISNMFLETKMPFSRNYIPTKNLFIIRHKQPKSKKGV